MANIEVFNSWYYDAINDFSTSKLTSTSIPERNMVMQGDQIALQIASTESTYIFSGPPLLQQAVQSLDKNILKPIGLLQSYTMGGGVRISPFTELGNKRYMKSRGRAEYNINFNRMLVFHSNLVYSLYSWLVEKGSALDMVAKKLQLLDPICAQANSKTSMAHFVNLASDLLYIPFGILIIIASDEGIPISSAYLEDCQLRDFQQGGSIGASNIMESVNISAAACIPASGIAVGERQNPVIVAENLVPEVNVNANKGVPKEEEIIDPTTPTGVLKTAEKTVDQIAEDLKNPTNEVIQGVKNSVEEKYNQIKNMIAGKEKTAMENNMPNTVPGKGTNVTNSNITKVGPENPVSPKTAITTGTTTTTPVKSQQTPKPNNANPSGDGHQINPKTNIIPIVKPIVPAIPTTTPSNKLSITIQVLPSNGQKYVSTGDSRNFLLINGSLSSQGFTTSGNISIIDPKEINGLFNAVQNFISTQQPKFKGQMSATNQISTSKKIQIKFQY